MKLITVIIGTRPEAIKLVPLALSLKKSDKIENFEKNLRKQKSWIIND